MSRRLYTSRLENAAARKGDALDAALDAMDAQRANFCADDPGIACGFDTHMDIDEGGTLPSELRALHIEPRPIHSVTL